jgi:predicted ATPase/DNA-binding XRE family transcriptional regulator
MGSTEPSSFGELLKRYRTAAGLTQEELAERAGLSARGVQDLERGTRRSPHPGTARRLAEALGLRDVQRAALLQTAQQAGTEHGLAKQAPLAHRRETLPVPLTPLIGRDGEVDRVRRLLERSDVRLLTLVGPAGAGKTRLALALAGAVAEGSTHGVAFVDLAPLADPAHVPAAIAYSLGLREAGRTPLSETLCHYLHDRRVLLVLDNFEHLLTASSTLAELLSTNDRLKILVTSRSVLRVYGECIFSVPPLELPPAGELLDCEHLAECSAIRLFVERVQASDPSFVLTPENAAIVEAICRRLDGLPLALELAASRVRLLPLGALLSRVEYRLPVLVGGARNLPPRHQTLRAAIDWSYGLLGPPERALFRRLGLFAGGCALSAVAAVCMRDEPGGVDALEQMGELVDASLVLQQPGASGEPRFWLLETLREYALEQLAAAGELAATRRAHAEYYVAFAESAEREQFSLRQRLVWDRFTEEHDNIRAALGWCEELGEVEIGLRLVGAMHPSGICAGTLVKAVCILSGS